jgi:MSHA biogenesis protein MshI
VKLSRKVPSAQDWVAVAIDGRRVDVARVEQRPGQRPRLAVFTTAEADPDASAVLKRLTRELRLARARVTALMPQGDYALLPVEAPDVPSAELRTAVRWRLKDVLEYPPEEAAIDVVPLPQGANGGGRSGQVLAVAARTANVAACIELFDGARLGLDAIDIHEMAQRNLAALFEEGEKAVAMVSFTDRRGLFTITARGQLHLARTLDIGAEALSRSVGATRAGLLDRLALELQRSMDHFDRQFGGLQVSRLFVAPFSAVDELRLALAESLYVPVEILDVTRVLDIDDVPALRSRDAQGRHLRVLGAALRSA